MVYFISPRHAQHWQTEPHCEGAPRGLRRQANNTSCSVRSTSFAQRTPDQDPSHRSSPAALVPAFNVDTSAACPQHAGSLHQEIFSIEHVSGDLRGCVATSDQSRLYLDLATSLPEVPPSSLFQVSPGCITKSRFLSIATSSRFEKFMYKSSTWEKRAKLTNGRTSSGLITQPPRAGV